MVRIDTNTLPTRRLEAFDGSWTGHRLPNGMLAVHVPDPATDRFHLETMVRAGVRNETARQSGLSHLLEHMMFRGTRRLPRFIDLAEEFEWLGGEWNAATGHEHTEYSYDGIRHGAFDIVELFSEFMESPQLNDLGIEREIILREIEGDTNEFGHSTDLDLHLSQLLWPGTSLALPILGTPECIAAIGRDDLRAYRREHYVPAKMCVLAVGGDGDGILKRFESTFGRYRMEDRDRGASVPPTPPAFRGPRLRWVEDGDNEYRVVIAFGTEGEGSAKECGYEVLARILSDGFCSRLYSRLCDRLGLVYDVEADSTALTDVGTLEIVADVHPERLDDFLRETLRILVDLRDNGPAGNEFERSRFRSVVDLDLSPSRPDSTGSRLCWAGLCGREYSLLDHRRRFQALELPVMRALCEEVFRKENLAVVILGPKRRGLIDDLRRIIDAGL